MVNGSQRKKERKRRDIFLKKHRKIRCVLYVHRGLDSGESPMCGSVAADEVVGLPF